jgi:hypothetical protein
MFWAEQHAQADGNKSDQCSDDHKRGNCGILEKHGNSSHKYLFFLPGQKYIIRST